MLSSRACFPFPQFAINIHHQQIQSTQSFLWILIKYLFHRSCCSNLELSLLPVLFSTFVLACLFFSSPQTQHATRTPQLHNLSVHKMQRDMLAGQCETSLGPGSRKVTAEAHIGCVFWPAPFTLSFRQSIFPVRVAHSNSTISSTKKLWCTPFPLSSF